MKETFILCGLTGWCFECFFTGFHGLLKKDKTLSCHTSLWMFCIYGMGALIKPLYSLLKNVPKYIRGIVYTILIFITEYSSGAFLKKHSACPWDYSKAKYNINGLIRLDYAPFWFIVGLIYENILTSTRTKEKL